MLSQLVPQAAEARGLQFLSFVCAVCMTCRRSRQRAQLTASSACCVGASVGRGQAPEGCALGSELTRCLTGSIDTQTPLY